MQWLFIFGLPRVVLQNYLDSKKIKWLSYYEEPSNSITVITIIVVSFAILYFANYRLYIRYDQKEKILAKYENRYLFVENYPVVAFFVFFLILPFSLLALIVYVI